MPISTALDKTRADLAEPISRRDVVALLRDSAIRVVQTSSPISVASWTRLDAELFSQRPEIQLRVYGFNSSECDLSFARAMNNVRHFAADCLRKARNVDSVAAIPALESLSIGIFELESFCFLEGVSPNLSRLFLGATRSKKPSLEPLARLTNLRELYLEGQQKEIEILSDLITLQDLTLRSIVTPNLEYIADLPALWSLDIKLGGIRDLSATSKVKSLKYLELWQIRGLEDVSVISGLSSLQNLFLQSLSRVISMPRLERCESLRRIVLQNMRGLKDLSALQFAPALEEFLLLQGEASKPDDLAPVLRNPRLVRAGAFFGSNAKNNEFQSMLRSTGRSTFERTPFEYR
ncbi:MAG: hypothetical protein CMLOHMNK_02904 [Steroidobacteraceae bacterium]|nr:hypothetical protein [Steroidobacteraceae bacterium]